MIKTYLVNIKTLVLLQQEQQVEKRFVFQSHLVDLHSIPSTYLHLVIRGIKNITILKSTYLNDYSLKAKLAEFLKITYFSVFPEVS